MTTREFVQNMIGGDIDREIPMTLADAIYNIECYREEGTDLPEDITPELFQETWNELIYEGRKENGVTVGTFRVNEGHYYDGWEGVNYRKWKTSDELKTMLRNDFKTAGIKATVRSRRGGYSTRITITLCVSEDDIMPFEEFAKDETRLFKQSWLSYRDEAGNVVHVHHDELFSGKYSFEEYADLKNKMLRYEYDRRVDCIKSGRGSFRYAADVLNADAFNTSLFMMNIVDSYNRDCSDAMTDYFDRAICDMYEYKYVA